MASYARATMPTSRKARRVGNPLRARRAARGNGGGVISFIRGARPPGGGIGRGGSPFHSRTWALCARWEWRVLASQFVGAVSTPTADRVGFTFRPPAAGAYVSAHSTDN